MKKRLVLTIAVLALIIMLIGVSVPTPVPQAPAPSLQTIPSRQPSLVTRPTDTLTQASPSPSTVVYSTGTYHLASPLPIPRTGTRLVEGPQPSAQDQAPEPNAWPMAAANSQRTSWSPEEIKGSLPPQWYRAIEPFIPARVQIVAANGLLYIATARGLYALNADSGQTAWIFPTELPLGNSPTVVNGVAYVGGFDRKIHALDALTGQELWNFEAGAGFDTNPLVIGDVLYAGNRDGYFYALYINGPQTAQLAWKFKTGGQIHFSAAYQDGVVYFVSEDSFAYALKADTGDLVWKSTKLPGAGFHSWWPVVYKNMLLIPGSSDYRHVVAPGPLSAQLQLEWKCVAPHNAAYNSLMATRLAGNWLSLSKLAGCMEKNPALHTFFVLDRMTGKEITYDYDRDHKADFVPAAWYGGQGGTRYPPIVASDGMPYISLGYRSNTWIYRGHVAGLKLGTNRIKPVAAGTGANDEPIAYSAGGNVIYWSQCCDRSAGGIDLSKPLTSLTKVDPTREWYYFGYNLEQVVPGYNEMYYSSDIDTVYGGKTGTYGQHGDQSPPIPYQGKLFMIKSNTIIAFGRTAAAHGKLPIAKTVSSQEQVFVDNELLRYQLAVEVQKILDAGHLRPGYGISGAFDRVGDHERGDRLLDYWHEPGDVLVALLAALPYLPEEMRPAVRTYLQNEFTNYPPYKYVHIGWKDGAAREAFNLPADVNKARASWGPEEYPGMFPGWKFPPTLFYALWKYAAEFGGAKDIFDKAKSRLEPVPPNSLLADMPYVHNAYIAGYMGYLELEKMAGYPETAQVRSELNRLLTLRAQNFTKDLPPSQLICNPSSINANCYGKTLNVASNFMYLVPELGLYLHDNAQNKVDDAVNEYNTVAPYWFVSEFEQTYAEGLTQPLYNSQMFLAKAWILKQPPQELAKYLDAPVFAVGDLFYIQNLTVLLSEMQ